MSRNPLPYLVNPAEGGRKASLINRVHLKAEARDLGAQTEKEKKPMARKRKLYGAAAAAHAKKAGRKSAPKRSSKRRKARKARRSFRRSAPLAAAPAKRRKAKRERHQVKRYHRKGGRVSSYSRRGANVQGHWSNPANFGGVAMEGLIAAGAILGTLLVVGYANGHLQKFGPTQSGWGNLAGKFALAVGAGVAAGYAYKRRMISDKTAYAITGAAMAPLLLGGLAMLSPQVAGMVTLAGGMDEESSVGVGNVVSYGAVGAELHAQLEAQLEAEREVEDNESGMI
jgi:hypothetical protein